MPAADQISATQRRCRHISPDFISYFRKFMRAADARSRGFVHFAGTRMVYETLSTATVSVTMENLSVNVRRYQANKTFVHHAPI